MGIAVSECDIRKDNTMIIESTKNSNFRFSIHGAIYKSSTYFYLKKQFNDLIHLHSFQLLDLAASNAKVVYTLHGLSKVFVVKIF